MVTLERVTPPLRRRRLLPPPAPPRLQPSLLCPLDCFRRRDKSRELERFCVRQLGCSYWGLEYQGHGDSSPNFLECTLTTWWVGGRLGVGRQAGRWVGAAAAAAAASQPACVPACLGPLQPRLCSLPFPPAAATQQARRRAAAAGQHWQPEANTCGLVPRGLAGAACGAAAATPGAGAWLLPPRLLPPLFAAAGLREGWSLPMA